MHCKSPYVLRWTYKPLIQHRHPPYFFENWNPQNFWFSFSISFSITLSIPYSSIKRFFSKITFDLMKIANYTLHQLRFGKVFLKRHIPVSIIQVNIWFVEKFLASTEKEFVLIYLSDLIRFYLHSETILMFFC